MPSAEKKTSDTLNSKAERGALLSRRVKRALNKVSVDYRKKHRKNKSQ